MPFLCAVSTSSRSFVEVAEVSVGAQEVLRPVAVIAVEPGVLLDVLDDRRDPQRGDAERP